MRDLDRAAKYYSFMRWLKSHHKTYYILYGLHVTVPEGELKIQIKMDYIAPEDKEIMKKIVAEFNAKVFD